MPVVSIVEGLPGGVAARRIGVAQTNLPAIAERERVKITATPLGRLYDAADIERVATERQARRQRQPADRP